MKRFFEEVQFLSPVQFFYIDKRTWSTFVSGDTTPDVKNNEWFKCNTGVVTITNFLGGQECQRIHIKGNNNTTIANNSNIKTNTGANKALASDKIYRFTYDLENTIWIEDA